MPRLFRYLNFLLTSTNRHGVHSPFIFRYVTECLHSKKKLASKKSLNVLLKSISHFEVKSVALPFNNESIQNQLISQFSYVTFGTLPYDLMFMDIEDYEPKYLEQSTQLHNGTIMIFDNLYRNDKASRIWEAIKAHEKVTVTLDLFHCGVVFFRKEQVKEHFKIRI